MTKKYSVLKKPIGSFFSLTLFLIILKKKCTKKKIFDDAKIAHTHKTKHPLPLIYIFCVFGYIM